MHHTLGRVGKGLTNGAEGHRQAALPSEPLRGERPVGPFPARPPLAGVRTRAELDDEIAQENRAIARIEEAIDNYIPPTCEFCSASAMDWCSLCDRPMCEDDSVADGICIECDAELLS